MCDEHPASVSVACTRGVCERERRFRAERRVFPSILKLAPKAGTRVRNVYWLTVYRVVKEGSPTGRRPWVLEVEDPGVGIHAVGWQTTDYGANNCYEVVGG